METIQIIIGSFFLFIGLIVGFLSKENYKNITKSGELPLYMGEYSDDRWHKLFYIGSPFLTALIGLLLILIGLFQ